MKVASTIIEKFHCRVRVCHLINIFLESIKNMDFCSSSHEPGFIFLPSKGMREKGGLNDPFTATLYYKGTL